MMSTIDLPDKTARFEIRLAGSGGQGVILAGIMLAEAATQEGRYASQSQTYGPEARGGDSRADVVLSGVEIDYPWSVEVDVLVALTQHGYDQNVESLKEDGLVIADSELVHRMLWRKAIRLPFHRIARETGEERAINMAALGALVHFCPYVSRDSLAKVMERRLPPKKLQMNLAAFDKCIELAMHANHAGPQIKEEPEI